LAAAGLAVAGGGLFLATGAASAAPSPLGSLIELSGSPGGGGYLYGVSCSDATDCTAVGDDNNSQPIYATETAGTWGTPVEVPVPPAFAPYVFGDFTAVSCSDASDCTAVGYVYNSISSKNQPIYATETAGVWGTPVEIASASAFGYFYGVSCTDALDCTAVGYDFPSDQPMYATETAGVWPTTVTEVSGSPSGAGYFNAVSCSDALDCTAVGEDGNDQPFYATETAGTWGTPVEIASASTTGYFTGVSCTDALDCTAVGYDENDGQPMYATETAGVWPTTVTEVSGSPGGHGYFNAVSCTDASDCTAVGYDGNGQTFYATETAGTWGTPVEITVPAALGGHGYFYGVSCTDALHCTAVGYDVNDQPIVTTALALPPGGSQVHAVIQVETSPSFADDTVTISSTQLQIACGGQILFETLQKGSTIAPKTSFNAITVALDDDGNVTVVVDGDNCAAGSDLIEADMPKAPYLTATTSLVVLPPQVTTAGVAAYPSTEVETGNSAASGNSDVYTVFYVETDPSYAEQPVTITSPELQDRCGEGWRWEPGTGTAIDQASGTTAATGTLDNDGNAVFVFKGASCAAGTSTVTADVDAGTHSTYTTTFTVSPPVETAASAKMAASKAPKPHHRHHRHHKGSGGGGSGSGGSTPSMSVTASPNPLVETGSGTQSGQATLNVVKSDDQGGTSGPPATLGFVAGGCCEITYTITVSNSGTAPISGVTVSDDLADNNTNLYEDSFTAVGTGGASGFTPAATGTPFVNIDDTVDLPAGSTITYTVVAGVDNQCTTLSNTVTLTPPGGSVISPTSNLSATDNDSLGGADCG
jgi:uncharacterized repeat protein (TIGR01451 family)